MGLPEASRRDVPPLVAPISSEPEAQVQPYPARILDSYGALSTRSDGLQDSVHQRRGGGADVERVHVPPDRQRYGGINRLRHPRAQASALRAEDEHDAALVVELAVRAAGRVRAVDPRLLVLGGDQVVGDVAN